MILKDDVTAAIRRAFQLGQTYWQQADSESYKENKKADATRDRYNALCIETAEIAARADTRITELERECSQWRDELRIYRETESKRIAELERSVTVRDTEIARLETDSELARRDAERYRWLRDQGGREVDTPWVVFRGGTWFLRSELDAAIDAAMGRGESA